MTIGIDISQIVYPGSGVGTLTRSLVVALLARDTKNTYILFGASLRQIGQLREFGEKFPKTKKVFLHLPPSVLEILWNRLHIIGPETFCGQLDIFITSDWTDPPTQAKKISPVYDLVVNKYPEYSHRKTEFRVDSFAPSANIVATQIRRTARVKSEASVVLTISESSREDIVRILGIPKEKIVVIYPAPATSYLEFAALPEEAREKKVLATRAKYQLEKDYFLTVGTREPRKNLPRLFDAFETLGFPDLRLVVVGKYGWDNKGSAVGPKERKNVVLLGYVSQEDLPALYAGAVGFVFPTLYEGFGIPVVEAQAVGCPVITSRLSSLPEAGGEAAWYVDPIDVEEISVKMRELVELSPTQRDKLVAAGVKQSQQFSWDKAADKIISLYEKLV